MTGVYCFTSFTFSYLSRALILVRTVRAAHPDWIICAVIADEPPNGNDCGLHGAFDYVVYAKELPFVRFYSWLFKHDIVEASTAVKGEMLCHLLERGAEKVVYLDPDVAVFDSLSGITDSLNRWSIILTPHQVHPNESEGLMRDNELTSLKYGIYNLGFVAVRNDDVGNEFGRWWARQLYIACYDDVANGMFTDQKWCDLVPALFDRVQVNRDSGCNVASWNLSTRTMQITTGGNILVNGSPLRFFHFTKINSVGDLMIDKNAQDNTEAMEVWNWYKRSLAAINVPEVTKGYWRYGRFDNGVQISKEIRVLFRGRADLYHYFSNPFATKGNSFYEWLKRDSPGLLPR